MKERKENTSSDSTRIFENDYAYAIQEGEIRLKKTSYFDEKTIATSDPEAIEQKVKELEDAFIGLQSLADQFIEELENEEGSRAESEEKFKELLQKIENAEAIGDFETLISRVHKQFEQHGREAEAAQAEESGTEDSRVETNEMAEEVETEGDETEGAEEVRTEAADAAEGHEEIPVVQDATPGDGDDDAEPGTGSDEATEAESRETESDASADGGSSENEVETYYKDLASKAETLMELSDWSYATMEFENLDHQWGEGPDPEGVEIKQYKERIDELREQLEEKKRAHYEEQKKVREENLVRKKELLEELKEIIEKEQWSRTKPVARIKNRWESIRPVPAESQEEMESEFQSLLHTFDEHKVDRLVKQKQNEEDNLTGKLLILEKMDRLSAGISGETKNWSELEKNLSDLSRQFRKIGRVPSERNQGIWSRFHEAQDNFHAARFQHDDKYRKNIEKYLSRKKKLIDEAEALVDMDDIAKAARKVNKLHRQWKKAGNLPQKEENELWDKFKAATDTFNEKKGENIDLLRNQEDQNLTEKSALIREAEELKESEEWETAHKQFQQLMDKWKAIGPVPRRKSGKIWKDFKKAMDYFYDRRRDHFKEVKEERKDNLKEKEEVLDKLKELTTHENPVEAVELAKSLQEEFKKAGYVPIKHKNRMWKEYREICDVIYDRFRAAKSAAQIVGKENVENFSVDDITEIKNKQEKANKIRKEIQTLSSDLIQMKESLSYFKPSGGESPVLDEVRGRIDKAEKRILQKEEQLEEIEVEIDKIKKDI